MTMFNRRAFLLSATAALSAAAMPVRAKTAGQGGSPLVNAAWLKQRLSDANLRLINLTSPDLYRRAHIPGSVFSDFGKWRVTKNGIPALMPDVPYLEKLLGALGVAPEHHVVLVPGGFSAGDIGVATRVYWTLKTLGHEKVSVLDGGIRAWAANRANPLTNTPVTPKPATYKANFTPRWLADAKMVSAASATGKPLLIDNRTYDEYMGMTPAGGSVLRSGTIPRAVLVPQHWFIDPRTGLFRPPAQLAAIHRQMGAKDSGEAITFCNTGHRASLGWFARNELMGLPTRMYDGSMAEWTRLKPAENFPVERKIKL